MSAQADSSAKTEDTYKGHATVSCLEGDLVASAVINSLLKLRPAFCRDPTLRSAAGQVLLASSEQALAEHWGNLRQGAVRIIALSEECYKDRGWMPPYSPTYRRPHPSRL